MRRISIVAMALALLACSESHGLLDAGADDAARPDAPTPPDARDAAPPPDVGLDAFCADHDGDGFAEVACGGDDCDDMDPTLSPEAGPCVGPTSARRCVAGMIVDTTCEDATPSCDARTGACVARGEACGDGVLHAEEDCDGTPDCDAFCRIYCIWSLNCPARLPFCADDETRTHPHCVAGSPGGAPDGSPCVVASDCAGGWCDPDQGRCSVLCSGAFVCDPDPTVAWCGLDAYATFGGVETLWPAACEFPCGAPSDCPADSACTVLYRYLLAGYLVTAACHPRVGGLGLGEACGVGTECTGGNCVAGRCTTPCRTDDDCATPMPHCLEHDYGVVAIPAVPLSQFPRICTP